MRSRVPNAGPARLVVGGALVALAIGIALLWGLWGFRWPPTPFVMAGPDAVDEEPVRLEGHDEPPPAPAREGG